MKRLLPILLCSLLLSGLRNATAQEASKTWTLQECLDYAYQNNIQVRQSRNNQLSGIEDTKQAKAALFPSLVASTTQSYTNYPSSEVTDNNSYTGTYGITAGMTIFEGGKLRTEVKRQKVQNQMDALSVEESVNDIRIAIVQAYMQCLYAADAVRINRSTAEASKGRLDMKKGLAEYANMSPGQRPVIARETFRDISDIRHVTSDGKITSVPCPECGRTLSNGEWLSLGAVRKNNICTCPEHGEYLVKVVCTAARGFGAGEALVRAAQAHAAAVGAGKVMLTSNPSRGAARRL